MALIKRKNIKLNRSVTADFAEITEETGTVQELIGTNQLFRVGLGSEDKETQTPTVIIVTDAQAKQLTELEARQRNREAVKKQLYGKSNHKQS